MNLPLFVTGIFTTFFIGMFVLIWIVDDLKMAIQVMGATLAVCAFVAVIIFFWWQIALA